MHAASQGPLRLSDALADAASRAQAARRVDHDPVSAVRQFSAPADRELAGLVASSLAFGNASVALRKAREALARLDDRPSVVAHDRAALRARLDGFVHRIYRGEHVAALLHGAWSVQRRHGLVGAHVGASLAAGASLREALSRLVADVRAAGGLDDTPGGKRVAEHMLPSPMRGGACKRLLLFARWMTRPDDGVDMGVWSGLVPTSSLLVPVDVHIHRMALNLGLTKRRAATWQTAEEITEALRRVSPDDPTKHDFALCHLGMVVGCRSRRDVVVCAGCAVKPCCRHWARRR